MNLKIKVYRTDIGVILELTSQLKKITWQSSLTDVCRTLEFTYAYGIYDSKLPQNLVNSGDIVYFYINGDEVFRGELIQKTINAKENEINVFSIDYAYYFKKSKIYKNFDQILAQDAVIEISKDLEIEVGDITKSDIPVTRLFPGISAYECIMQIYTELYKKTGVGYYMHMEKNKLNVTEVDYEVADIVLTGNTNPLNQKANGNIIDLQLSDTMANMINKVQIVNETAEIIETLEYGDTNRYGVLQEIYKQSDIGEDEDKERASRLLHGIDNILSIDCVGNISFKSGKSVRVIYPKISFLNDIYMYITSDSHVWNFKDNTYITSLELTDSRKMDEKYYTTSEDDVVKPVQLGDLTAGDYSYCTTEEQKKILSLAYSQLGVPYVWGGSEWNKGMDCSGFTQQVYNKAGYSLSRTTYTQVNEGKQVSRDDLEPGDLVFPKADLGHVGIYIGGGKVIEEPRTGDVCKITTTFGFYTARRILTTRTPISKTSNSSWTSGSKQNFQVTFYTNYDAGVIGVCADGTIPKFGTIAGSKTWLYGTKFKFEGIDWKDTGYSDVTFEMHDRGGNEFLNPQRIDIWIPGRPDIAEKLGRQNVTGYIVK